MKFISITITVFIIFFGSGSLAAQQRIKILLPPYIGAPSETLDPTGRTLCVGEYSGHSLTIFDIESGAHFFDFTEKEEIISCEYDQTGNRIIYNTGQGIFGMDIYQRKQTFAIPNEQRDYPSFALHTSMPELYMLNRDKHELLVYSTVDGKLLRKGDLKSFDESWSSGAVFYNPKKDEVEIKWWETNYCFDAKTLNFVRKETGIQPYFITKTGDFRVEVTNLDPFGQTQKKVIYHANTGKLAPKQVPEYLNAENVFFNGNYENLLYFSSIDENDVITYYAYNMATGLVSKFNSPAEGKFAGKWLAPYHRYIHLLDNAIVLSKNPQRGSIDDKKFVFQNPVVAATTRKIGDNPVLEGHFIIESAPGRPALTKAFQYDLSTLTPKGKISGITNPLYYRKKEFAKSFTNIVPFPAHDPKGKLWDEPLEIKDAEKVLYSSDKAFKLGITLLGKVSLYNLITKSKVNLVKPITLEENITAIDIDTELGFITIVGNGNIHIFKMDGTPSNKIKIPKGWEPQSSFLSPDGTLLYAPLPNDGLAIARIEDGRWLGIFHVRDEKNWAFIAQDGRIDGTQAFFNDLTAEKNGQLVRMNTLFDFYYTPDLFVRLLAGEEFPPLPNIDPSQLPNTEIKVDLQRNLTVEEENSSSISTALTSVKLNLKTSCNGCQLAEIRLYQNNKLLSTRNLVVEDDAAAATTLSRNQLVELQPGDNVFKAVGITKDGIEGVPARLNVFCTKKPGTEANNTGDRPKMYIMLVGINQYQNGKYNLNYAVPDAEGLAKQLAVSATPVFGPPTVVSLFDQKATKKEIESAFQQLKQQVRTQDVFVFYYAGHGIVAASEDDRDNAKNNFYLVPHDVTNLFDDKAGLSQKGISAQQLFDFSRELSAQKQLFLLDACQSAGAFDDLVKSRGAQEEKAIAQLARSTGTHWIAAAGSEQFASEFAQLGHGTFTYALIQALSGKADLDANGQVSVNEIKAYLEDVTPELTAKYKGTPQYPASYGFGNDFPVGVK
jgi:hypothetical protein